MTLRAAKTMSVSEEINKELKSLLSEQTTLLKQLDKLDSAQILAFGTAYQAWYTRATKLIDALAPDRLSEFVSYYRVDPKRKTMDAGTYVIQDYVNGYG